MVLAHISDTHLDEGAQAHGRAEAMMRHLATMTGIDAVVHTGDVTDHGTLSEYAEAAKVLTGPYPVLHCPGNHDRRGPYREGLLGEDAEDGPIDRLHRVTGRDGTEALIAMCDSTVPGEPHGRLGDATLAWLDDALRGAPAGVPMLVGFHHPPLELGIPYVDGIRQVDAERLAEVVWSHANVAGILCGHAHTPAVMRFAGVPLAVAGGVVSTLRLPYEPDAEAIVDLAAPPVVSLHLLGGDAERGWSLITHHRAVTLP
ncbi:MAG: phosphodiesterase [Streptosporangiales bacterium]|nr:phosphodiesterase [Streptosporangiales bacterium]